MKTFQADRALLIVLVLGCAASVTAETGLAPVKDLPRTIGSASRTQGPFMFCALPDVGPIRSAYAAAAKSGRKPFVVGWELKVEPPIQLGRVLLITNLPRSGSLSSANCKVVQPLPEGGIDAIQLHTPYAAVDRTVDWSTGLTQLVVMTKNEDLPASDYVPRLKRHVGLVTQLFEPNGMDGYMVYAGENFEWAYLHWPDPETLKKAYGTPEGATGPQDSRSFQHGLGASVQIFSGNLASD